MSGHHPLFVNIEDGVLTIRIGVDVLAHAFEHSKYVEQLLLNRGEGSLVERLKTPVTIDAAGFAEDVLRELVDEAEDGSTAVTRMLDAACAEAVEQGSEHFTLGTATRNALDKFERLLKNARDVAKKSGLA